MPAISRAYLLSRAELHAGRHLQPSSKWFKSISQMLCDILEEEYEGLSSLTDEGILHSHGSITIRRRKPRVVSQYVTFCRYMKENHSNFINLQAVWRHVKNKDWQTIFPKGVRLSSEILRGIYPQPERVDSPVSSPISSSPALRPHSPILSDISDNSIDSVHSPVNSSSPTTDSQQSASPIRSPPSASPSNCEPLNLSE